MSETVEYPSPASTEPAQCKFLTPGLVRVFFTAIIPVRGDVALIQRLSK